MKIKMTVSTDDFISNYKAGWFSKLVMEEQQRIEKDFK